MMPIYLHLRLMGIEQSSRPTFDIAQALCYTFKDRRSGGQHEAAQVNAIEIVFEKPAESGI